MEWREWREERSDKRFRRQWKKLHAAELREEYEGHLRAMEEVLHASRLLREGRDVAEGARISHFAGRALAGRLGRARTAEDGLSAAYGDMERRLFGLRAILWRREHDEGRTELPWKDWLDREQTRGYIA
jgi:hypothetical protein